MDEWRTVPAAEVPIVWEEPPTPVLYRSPSHWRADVPGHFRQALEGKPGAWAVWPTQGLDEPTERTPKSQAYAISSGRAKWTEGGKFEARVAEGKLYVRALP